MRRLRHQHLLPRQRHDVQWQVLPARRDLHDRIGMHLPVDRLQRQVLRARRDLHGHGLLPESDSVRKPVRLRARYDLRQRSPATLLRGQPGVRDHLLPDGASLRPAHQDLFSLTGCGRPCSQNADPPPPPKPPPEEPPPEEPPPEEKPEPLELERGAEANVSPALALMELKL